MVRLIVLTLITAHSLFAQESLNRVKNPFVYKWGFEGVGLDVTIFNHLGLDATTWFFYNSAKIRYLILNSNTTPFVGLGVGFGANVFAFSGANSWKVVHGGFEHSFESFMIQILVQYPFEQTNPNTKMPFLYSVNAGIRF